MNERIKKLKELASKVLKQPDTDNDGLTVFDNDELEKFFELIVKECADEAKYHVMNISTYADADFVYEQIKRHFGVEE